MSDESKSVSKSKSSKSRSSSGGPSKSYSSKSYSSRSSSSSKSKSSNSIKNSEDKNLVDGFVSSLFDDNADQEKASNQQEEKLVEGFISSLFDEEEKKGQKNKTGKAKKKIVKNKQKNGATNKANKTQRNTYKNANNNSKLYSTNKKLNMQNNNRNYATTRDIGQTTKRKVKNSLKEGDTNSNQHKRTKTPDNIRKINPKVKMIKYKKSRDITPICNINKKERKNHSVEKRIITGTDRPKHSKNLNRTLDYQVTEMSKQYKAKIESDKEKKEYEEKIRLMKNHILAMKRQQEDMNKKINFLKHKEDSINTIKKEREYEKKAILEYNITRKTELAEKRKHIEKQREIMNKQIKESSEKVKMEKINKYKQSKKEMLEASNKINNTNQNKIQNQIKKIKALRENNRNIALNRKKILNKNYNDLYEQKYEKNLEKTQRLKLEMKRLQDEEDELMNKLNQTRERLNTFNSSENIYFFMKRSRKESGNI